MLVNQQILSVSSILDQAVQNQPEREAIYDLTRRLTYAELNNEACKVANGLIKMGVQKGDHIGVCLPNWHETVVIFFAIAKVGAVAVPFNPLYRRFEVEHIVKNSEVKTIFISEQFKTLIGIQMFSSLVENYISVRFLDDECKSYLSLINTKEIVFKNNRIDPIEDIFCILYTSGTTGLPKGVMLTHQSIVLSGCLIAETIHSETKDVFIVPAPLFHIFGIALNLIAAFCCQAKLVLLEKFNPEQTLQLIESEKVSVHHAVPSMFILELNHPNINQYDLSSLRTGIIGAAPCPPETIRQIREKLGLNLCISYGTSETGSLTITDYHDSEKNIIETIGKAIEGVSIKIVDKERKVLPVGEIGEIAVKGLGLMKGYYKQELETKAVIDHDGWFYTGDLGEMNEQGYIIFKGRKKEMVIRGGYNIYPQELESILAKNSKIQESAIIGLPDEVLGEVVCVVIKLKNQVKMTAKEVIDYLSPLVAKYKIPSQVLFTENFPVTSSGKIQKMKLREQILNAEAVDIEDVN